VSIQLSLDPRIPLFNSRHAVLGETFTHTYKHTLKQWKEKVVIKLNAILPHVTYNIWTNSIWPIVCAPSICFLVRHALYKSHMGFCTMQLSTFGPTVFGLWYVTKHLFLSLLRTFSKPKWEMEHLDKKHLL